MTDPAEIEREALRLHQRYAEEIVERFDICPWARKAREAGEWERFVLPQRDEALGPLLDLVTHLEEERPQTVVAIAILPSLPLDPAAFDRFVGRFRAADQERHQGSPIFVAATFHPEYPINRRSAASLVPYFRRSPDPSIQLIRLKILDDARGPSRGKFVFDFSPAAWAELERREKAVDITKRITQDNAGRLEAESVAAFEAIYADLFADRDRTYERLGHRRCPEAAEDE